MENVASVILCLQSSVWAKIVKARIFRAQCKLIIIVQCLKDFACLRESSHFKFLLSWEVISYLP